MEGTEWRQGEVNAIERRICYLHFPREGSTVCHVLPQVLVSKQKIVARGTPGPEPELGFL